MYIHIHTHTYSTEYPGLSQYEPMTRHIVSLLYMRRHYFGECTNENGVDEDIGKLRRRITVVAIIVAGYKCPVPVLISSVRH